MGFSALAFIIVLFIGSFFSTQTMSVATGMVLSLFLGLNDRKEKVPTVIKRTALSREFRRYKNLIVNLQNWHVHFLDKFWFTSDKTRVYRTRTGINIVVPRRLRHEFKEVFFQECYTLGYSDIAIATEPTIIDIGANVGFFSLFAAHKYRGAKVYAFEPIRFNYEFLLQNVRSNPQINVKYFEMAVSSRPGKVSMSLESSNSFTTGASINKQDVSHKEVVEVESTSIAEIFIRNNIEHCHLMKMDCEGAEFDIIYNCDDEYLSKISNIALEVHELDGERMNIFSLRDYLMSKGYQLTTYGNILIARSCQTVQSGAG